MGLEVTKFRGKLPSFHVIGTPIQPQSPCSDSRPLMEINLGRFDS